MRGAPMRPAPFSRAGEMLGKTGVVIVLTAGLILAGVFWLRVVVPYTPLTTIPCPFEEVTGYECPGCGLQSSFMNLMQLRFKYVLMANLLSPILLPLFFVAVVSWGADYLFGMRIWRFELPRVVIIIGAVVLSVYWVLRNIPSLGVW
jgi:hypothetical protein